MYPQLVQVQFYQLVALDKVRFLVHEYMVPTSLALHYSVNTNGSDLTYLGTVDL